MSTQTKVVVVNGSIYNFQHLLRCSIHEPDQDKDSERNAISCEFISQDIKGKQSGGAGYLTGYLETKNRIETIKFKDEAEAEKHFLHLTKDLADPEKPVVFLDHTGAGNRFATKELDELIEIPL